MNQWELAQYDNVLDEFLGGCATDQEMEAAAYACLKELQEKGNATAMPVSEFLEDGIFQLRPHTGTKQGRILYYFAKGKRKAVIVHCFYKTTRATPRDVIDLAKRRRKELESAETISRARNGREKRRGH